MRAGRPMLLAAALALAPMTARAHPRGFHKHTQVIVHPDRVEILVRMDVDAGRRCEVLRRGVDGDGDGKLDEAEVGRLKTKLVELATRPLRARISGYALRPRVVEAKVGLRGDGRVSETGVSIAVLLEAAMPQRVFSGMELEIQDEAPDSSHVKVEAEQDPGDANVGPYAEADLRPGERLRLRLQGAM